MIDKLHNEKDLDSPCPFMPVVLSIPANKIKLHFQRIDVLLHFVVIQLFEQFLEAEIAIGMEIHERRVTVCNIFLPPLSNRMGKQVNNPSLPVWNWNANQIFEHNAKRESNKRWIFCLYNSWSKDFFSPSFSLFWEGEEVLFLYQHAFCVIPVREGGQNRSSFYRFNSKERNEGGAKVNWLTISSFFLTLIYSVSSLRSKRNSICNAHIPSWPQAKRIKKNKNQQEDCGWCAASESK